MREKITCDNCGSVHLLTSRDFPMRDKDSIECTVCDKTIFSWNGGIIWTAQLIERHEYHLKKP